MYEIVQEVNKRIIAQKKGVRKKLQLHNAKWLATYKENRRRLEIQLAVNFIEISSGYKCMDASMASRGTFADRRSHANLRVCHQQSSQSASLGRPKPSSKSVERKSLGAAQRPNAHPLYFFATSSCCSRWRSRVAWNVRCNVHGKDASDWLGGSRSRQCTVQISPPISSRAYRVYTASEYVGDSSKWRSIFRDGELFDGKIWGNSPIFAPFYCKLSVHHPTVTAADLERRHPTDARSPDKLR